MRRHTAWLLDSGPVAVLALIAGAGSFTHIRDTAVEHGQTGWMAWAVAVCIDLTCVMAARERQRDKRTGRSQDSRVTWPTLILTGGIVLSLAANLQQADPTAWGWITAATPAGAFLVAVSMLERRAHAPTAEPTPALVLAVPDDQPAEDETPAGPGPSAALLDYARRVATEHLTRHGKPITRDVLRGRLGVSNQLASDLLRALRAEPAQ
ncbi:DUF2637 domain-containing protein [Herbidospora cretacea]|uniref:DUF2637 domain-containing protein n=1 Tax=Herbidospora cretacea TaxID=28444 RepID=UPI0007744C0E|nr:DUF2637 domain-containing protein [Herbidospora cretacea]